MKRLGNNSKRPVSTHGAAKALLHMSGVLVVVVGLLATGPAKAAEVIKCAYPYWFGFAPTMVAEKLGYFAEEGVEVTRVFDNDRANLGFMRSLARELAPRGISVNAVCPGWVRTVASMRSLSTMAIREGRSEDDLLAEIVGAQAIGGLMEPEDMAAIYLFLASEAADNITGQALTVDRGEIMQ